MFNKNLQLFLQGKSPNFNRLYIYDIWNYSLEKLESKHNYIQWLFPTKQRSKYNIFAPIINDNFEINNKMKENMLKSLGVMLNFYGLCIKDDEIIKSSSFEERNKIWLRKNNHNFLRLTRILTSLKIFGLDKEANMLFSFLETLQKDNCDIISQKTLSYWQSAIKGE